MLHMTKDRDVCRLRTLRHCDMRNTFRMVTISTAYRYTSDINIPIIQGVSDQSRYTSDFFSLSKFFAVESHFKR